jgi:hypothetical protein
VLDHSYTRLTIGLLITLGAIFEISETAVEQFVEGFFGFEVRGHHGVLIFGIFTAARALHDMVEGVLFMGLEESIEHHQEGIANNAQPSQMRELAQSHETF